MLFELGFAHLTELRLDCEPQPRALIVRLNWGMDNENPDRMI